jgi:chromosome segregation ATPase
MGAMSDPELQEIYARDEWLPSLRRIREKDGAMMCWKQEWSHAINNINHALAHLQKAKEKLEKRASDRRETIKNAPTKCGRIDKAKEIIKDAEQKLEKNLEGIRLCQQQLDSLKENRSELLALIREHGFSLGTSGESDVRWVSLLGKCALCDSINDCLKESCHGELYCIWGPKAVTTCA